MSLGKAILTARKERAWTQKDLSQASRLAVSYISRIENGRIQPTMATVGRLAGAMDTTVSELVQRAEGFPSVRGHRCPVSQTGKCIGEQIRSTRGRTPVGQVVAYGDEELGLLRMTDLIALRGSADVRRALAIVLESFMDRVARE